MPRCPNCFIEVGQFPCLGCGYTLQEPLALALAPLTPLPGPEYVRYRIGRVLGKPGGFGITYLAWDEVLKVRVAIKEYFPRQYVARGVADRHTLLPHTQEDGAVFAAGLTAFLREAGLLANCRHPNIIHLRDFFEANGTAYLVMDYLPGCTLAEEVHRRGRLPWPEAVAWLRPILDALHALHQRGLLHRDVKPENVYLTENGTPLLLDFGAARQVVGEYSRSLTVVLTPGYAALEQYASGSQQRPWTDVYGAAATLYYSLTGQAPPEAPARLARDEWRPLGRVQPRLEPIAPNTLAAAVAKGLAVDGKNRFASAEAFARQLAALPVPKLSVRPSSHSWRLPLLGGAVATIVVAAILLWMQPLGAPPAEPPTLPVESPYPPSPSPEDPQARYLRELLSKAEHGNAVSQAELGWMYATGQGIDKDDTKASDWFRKAAKQGNPVGGMALSVMYMLGQGVVRDFDNEKKWRENSIEQIPNFFGYPELIKKLQQTAETGDVWSQMVLGEAYFYVSPTNYSKAVQWYGKASYQGDAIAQYKLGSMYKYGYGVPQDDQKAVEWYRESIMRGNLCGKIALGEMYLSGRGVQKNYKQAIDFLKPAEDFSEPYSCKRVVYEIMEDAQKDIWSSELYLGLFFRFVRKDEINAKKWIDATDKNKNFDSQIFNYLGDLSYLSGDLKEAEQWYQKSASRGEPEGQYKLGLIYLKKDNFDRSKIAYNWIKKAADQGYSKAKKLIEKWPGK